MIEPMTKVGMPRGLLYYYYGDVWRNFFELLGAEVVISGETTAMTLSEGGRVDEVCLPVKAAIGHVCELADKVDFLFLPRVVSAADGQYSCPNILGLPDLLRSCVPNLPPLLTATINLRQGRLSLYRAVVAIGGALGKNALASLYAWYQAGYSTGKMADGKTGFSQPRVALLGHPYIIYDRLISMNIIEKVRGLGFEVITADSVDDVAIEQATRRLPKKIFWQYSHRLAGAALALIYSLQPLAGMIFVTSFACGPDSMVAATIKWHADHHDIPFLLQTIDEHSAETGFITRLEAFSDMLLRGNNRCC